MKFGRFCAMLSILALQISAQSTYVELPDSIGRSEIAKKGQVEGYGTNFEITNSDYLDISLSSSIPVKLRKVSIPQTIYISIDSTYEDSAAIFTVNGLAPDTVYYLYSEKGILSTIKTDNSGMVSFSADLSYRHTFWIQPRPSTLYFKTYDNRTGWFDNNNYFIIDPLLNWNPATRTINIKRTVTEAIYIQLDNVIVEGNYSNVSGSGVGNGITISSNDVIVRCLNIDRFACGAFVTGDSVTIENCSFTNVSTGIRSDFTINSGKGRVYKNNSFSGSNLISGIDIRSSSDMIVGNSFMAPQTVGIAVDAKGNLVNIEGNHFTNGGTGVQCIGLSGCPDPVFIKNNMFQYLTCGINLDDGAVDGITIIGNNFISNDTAINVGTSIYGAITSNVFNSNIIAITINGYSNAIIRNTFNSTYGLIFETVNARINRIVHNIFNCQTNVIGHNTNTFPNNWTMGSVGGNWWNNHQSHSMYTIYIGNVDSDPYVTPQPSMSIFRNQDSIAPVTSSSLSVPQPDGDNGWYRQPVTLSLKSTDLSPIFLTLYTVQTNTLAPFGGYYDTPLEFFNGKISVVCFAFDNYGNTENPKLITINIDTTEPEIRCITTGIQRNSSGYYNEPGRTYLYCQDEDGGSGLRTWGYRINNGQYKMVTGNSADTLITEDGITNIEIFAIDSAGNEKRTIHQIKIDKYAPVPDVDPLPDLRGLSVVITTPPTAKDNLTGKIIGTTTSPLTYNQAGTYYIEWKYDDTHGNISTQIQKVVVVTDVTAPVPRLNPLPDAIGECSVTITAPVADDDFAGVVTATTNDPLTYSQQGTYTVTWTYTDGNNSTVQTQKVVVKDITPPVFTFVPANKTVEATGPKTVVPLEIAVAQDNCGTASVTSNAPATYGIGETVVTFTATDLAGNKKTATMTVTVTDKTAPVVPVIAAVESECSYTIVSAPVATDLVDGTIAGTTVSGGSLPLVVSGLGEHTIVWTFTDKSGNASSTSQKITIVDKTAPVFISVPANKTIEATGPKTVVALEAAKAQDNCGTVSVTSNAPAAYDLGETTVTFTATDLAGNTKTATMTVTVTDKTAPVVPVIAAVESECSYTIVSAPVAEDLVDGVITGTTVSGALPLVISGLGEHTIVWTFTDKSGNTSSTSQKITIIDRTAPVFISVPANKTIEATSPKTVVQLEAAVAQDNCGTVSVTSNAPAIYDIGETVVTFTATDLAGNTKTATMTVTVTDKTAPVAPEIEAVSNECSYTIETAPVAHDLVDGKITGTTTAGTLPLTITGLGDHTIVWTFTDVSGNISTVNQVVTIFDVTVPEYVSVPDNKIVEATGPKTVVALEDAVAQDNCGTVNVTSNAPAAYNIGETVVTFTATDLAGNTKTATMTVTVTDKTAPDVPEIEDVSNECSYTIETAPVAHDLVDGIITGTTTAGTLPLTITGLGDHTVVWNFTDASGNISTVNQVVTIFDNTEPQFTLVPQDMIIEATGPTTQVVLGDVVAEDNCGSVTVTSDAPQYYELGTTFVTFTATDLAGNTKKASMAVTIEDRTAPANPSLTPVESECSFTIESAPIAEDLVDGTITGSTDAGDLPITVSGLGKHVVVWTFTDKQGNSSTSEQMITIVDRTNPVLTYIPANVTIEATGPSTEVTLEKALAEDNCGTVSISSDAIQSYPVGVTTVTFTATDLAGNKAHASVTVTVTDKTAPVAPVVTSVQGGAFYTIDSAPVAYDLVDGNVVGIADAGPLPLTITGYGIHKITWTFTDKNGNSSTAQQIVTISMNSKVFMFDEAMNDPHSTNPRMYVKNTGDVDISDFKVEYYFRTENSKIPLIDNFYTPNATVSLEDMKWGYYKVVFNFKNTTLKPGQVFPNINGFVIGIHYENYTDIDETNDYSNNMSSVFQENDHICVYTADGRLISGVPPFINAEPVAYAGENITVKDSEGDGELVRLHGSRSFDPDGSIISYEWYFNGAIFSQDSIGDIQLSAGVHNIQLKVTDNNGSVAFDTVSVIVNGPEAEVSFSINTEPISVGTPVTVTYQIPESLNGAKVRLLLERTWDVFSQNLNGNAGTYTIKVSEWNRYFFGGKGPWTISFEVNGVIVDAKQISFNY